MKLTEEQQAQLLTPAIHKIMDALRGQGEARVVGGAVRDVLLNRKIGDIDLASTLPPEQMMSLLAAHHIKTVPTGLAHGTITAVIDHVGYEITTLRRDVETDGRHAQVAFTDDWREDAARRDFTFNALYVDGDGTLYDYFDGTTDAAAGTVRFIGDATQRITEDVLRILRFFRFFAFFAKGEPDAAALAACRSLADKIPTLSSERIANEVTKLLRAPNPLPAWKLMHACGITPHFAPQATNLDRLQNLLANEASYNVAPSPWTRLAALLPPNESAATALAEKLKLAKRDSENLRALATLPALVHTNLAPTSLRALIYRHGTELCRAAILLNGENIAPSLALVDTWENPIFPIRGEDLLKQGLPAGPQIGILLRATEDWWIAQNFTPPRPACLAHAKTLA